MKQGELMLSPELRMQLEQISVSSVRRMTQGMERDLPRRSAELTSKPVAAGWAGTRQPGHAGRADETYSLE